MASLVIGGLFNAISFAGASFLFQHLNKTGYEAEIKRHNHALETLAKAKEKWYENEVKKKDKINELRQQLSDANHDINETNDALDQLHKIQTIVYNNRTFTREPEFEDYYKPSEEMEKYQDILLEVLVWEVGGY